MQDKKILIIDDTAFMVKLISGVLEQEKFQIMTAFSGEEALELMKKERPDLILLDVVMPNMSGYDVLKVLRDDLRYNLIPIIMLTGQSEEEEKLKGLELGADDYIVKPFNPRELQARVKNTLVRLERSRHANPLTGLRGNNDIEEEIVRRITEDIPYAVLYLDLDSFKPYNDVYGFSNGDIAIKMTAEIVIDATGELGSQEDFIGHVGGDDFVLITKPELAVSIAEKVIEKFDIQRLALYSEEDREKGYISAKDRFGVDMTFDLIGISIAIIFGDKDKIHNTLDLSAVAAINKKKAKAKKGSAYAY